MDGDLTYFIRHHQDNGLIRLGGYVTLPLGTIHLRIFVAKFASRCSCRLPVQRWLDLFARCADQRGKWRPRSCSTFKPMAISYILYSRIWKTGRQLCDILSSLMSVLFASRRRFKRDGKDNGGIFRRATLTTEHR